MVLRLLQGPSRETMSFSSAGRESGGKVELNREVLAGSAAATSDKRRVRTRNHPLTFGEPSEK